jgi:hypothetical protein
MGLRRWRTGPALLLGLVLGMVLASACGAVGAAQPRREFELRHFLGLTAKVITSDDDATLDIDFDKTGGGLQRFAHCREVTPEQLGKVVPPQEKLAEMLRLNCLAVQRYARSQPARRSHMPARWSAVAVAKLPAELLPELGPGDVAPPTVTHPLITLARRPGARHIRLERDGGVRVNGTEVHALFQRLARADFDGDGCEDWLLRMDWGAQHADARGSQLILVTRLVAGGPLRVLERIAR